jgi:hypothetical protein
MTALAAFHLLQMNMFVHNELCIESRDLLAEEALRQYFSDGDSKMISHWETKPEMFEQHVHTN